MASLSGKLGEFEWEYGGQVMTVVVYFDSIRSGICEISGTLAIDYSHPIYLFFGLCYHPLWKRLAAMAGLSLVLCVLALT